MKRVVAVLQAGIRATLSVLFGAVLWLGLLLLVGIGLTLFGINALVGIAWAAIAGGVLCFLLAAVVILGLRNG